MARPRKIHDGKNVLIECVIRVPGQENESTVFEITKFSRMLPRNRNVKMLEQQIFDSLVKIYGGLGVKISHDVLGGS